MNTSSVIPPQYSTENLVLIDRDISDMQKEAQQIRDDLNRVTDALAEAWKARHAVEDGIARGFGNE